MNKYIMELIGTFFLVLTIGLTVIGGGGGVIPPLAIGSVLMAMVFAGGHISGGHYNPAVTLAVWIRGRCETKDVVPYWVVQIIGAAAAAGVVKMLRAGVAVTPMTPRCGPGTDCGVYLYFCSGFRRGQYRHCQRQCGKFVLWTGHWLHCARRRFFGRKHIRRGL